MTFHVLNLATGKLHESEPGVAKAFDNGRDAATFAQQLTEQTGDKHQPRRAETIASDDWKAREQSRFDSGEYTPLPWLGAPWFNTQEVSASYRAAMDSYHDASREFYSDGTQEKRDALNAAMAAQQIAEHKLGHGIRDHFAHVALGKRGMVAFTESAEKGAQDRQTRLAPGRYLERYFSHALDEYLIRRYATEFGAMFDDVELRFAHSADDIEHVYRNGPSSCMSDKRFDSGIHPTRVYAGPDLAVAYITTATDDDSDESGNITARAVCWPDKKIYGRVYGDATRLERKLAEAGYRATYNDSSNHGEAFEGARMRLVRRNGGIVCPFLDMVGNVDIEGDYLVMRRNGDLNAGSTDGLIDNEPEYTCHDCGEGLDSDNVFRFDGGDHDYCESCYDARCFYCDQCETHQEDCDDSVNMRHGGTWCQSCFDHHGFTCDETDRNYHVDDCITMADGRSVCSDWHDRNAFVCDETGESYDLDDRVTLDDGRDVCREWYNDNRESIESGDDDSVPRHRARQGRDESPDQTEIPLTVAPSVVVNGITLRVGDFIRLGHNGESLRNLSCYAGRIRNGGIFQIAEIDRGDFAIPVRIRDLDSEEWWIYREHVLARVSPSDAAMAVNIAATQSMGV